MGSRPDAANRIRTTVLGAPDNVGELRGHGDVAQVRDGPDSFSTGRRNGGLLRVAVRQTDGMHAAATWRDTGLNLPSQRWTRSGHGACWV